MQASWEVATKNDRFNTTRSSVPARLAKGWKKLTAIILARNQLSRNFEWHPERKGELNCIVGEQFPAMSRGPAEAIESVNEPMYWVQLNGQCPDQRVIRE